jgi:hypothetical protein
MRWVFHLLLLIKIRLTLVPYTIAVTFSILDSNLRRNTICHRKSTPRYKRSGEPSFHDVHRYPLVFFKPSNKPFETSNYIYVLFIP